MARLQSPEGRDPRVPSRWIGGQCSRSQESSLGRDRAGRQGGEATLVPISKARVATETHRDSAYTFPLSFGGLMSRLTACVLTIGFAVALAGPSRAQDEGTKKAVASGKEAKQELLDLSKQKWLWMAERK